MKEFLEEFKYLEKLCSQIYGEQHGVTLYINEMLQKSGYASRIVAGWDSDLAWLRRVRHIRNILVHEPDQDVRYDQSDIAFMRSFYQRILNGQDPLTRLRIQMQQTVNARDDSYATAGAYPPYQADTRYSSHQSDTGGDGGNEGSRFGTLFIFGLVLILVFLIIKAFSSGVL